MLLTKQEKRTKRKQMTEAVFDYRTEASPDPTAALMQTSNIPCQDKAVRTTSMVRNFRSVAGLRNLFRSAAPDELLRFLDLEEKPLPASQRESKLLWPAPEALFLFDATMIIDLRMDTEIDKRSYDALTMLAPGGKFEEITDLDCISGSTCARHRFRVTCPEHRLGIANIYRHMEKYWADGKVWEDLDSAKRKELMISELNKRGLEGLFEIILEAKAFIRTILQAITLHLEVVETGKVILHCSVGKDRTGVLSMLCGVVAGCPDDAILEDFEKSSSMRTVAEKAFEEILGETIDAKSFGGASAETMRLTMVYLREKYGSISNYLTTAGFDQSWQKRLREVLR